MKWIWTNREATRADVKSQVGPGWGALLDSLIDDLETLGWDGNIAQVKEKFGGLRFYIVHSPSIGSTAIYDRITEAEGQSLETCEECGAPGDRKGGTGWIKCLCPEHRKERNEKTNR